MGQSGMANFGLREAAEQAGASKSSIWRAIKAGRLSATKTDGGDYSIDAAELFRTFPPRPEKQPLERPTGQTGRGDGGDGTDDLTVRLAAAEAEIAGLKALVDEIKASRDSERARGDELRQDLAAWRERVPIVLPAPAQRRPWWRRRVG
jgi:excisionase family DNA binding protein